MGKHMESVTNSLLSAAKALPLMVGAAAGLFIPPVGNDGPIQNAMKGDWQNAFNALSMNYAFTDTRGGGGFSLSQGKGVKALAVGVIAHKVVGWIAE